MDKRDIYEHLAKIYLDASSKGKKKTNGYPAVFKNLFFISLTFIFGLSAALLTTKNKSSHPNIVFSLVPEAAKINTSAAPSINSIFNLIEKERYTFNLNKLDLAKFKTLGFSVKRANYLDNVSLRVEFSSALREKSEVYFLDIPYRWRGIKINLSVFKNISDWSKAQHLSFLVEKWNVKDRKGVIIDNVRLLKERRDINAHYFHH